MTASPLITDLQRIPGVGPSIAQDLRDLGVSQMEELRDANPEHLYERLCFLRGATLDRCVLYVLRCAVYFASQPEHDPELLKWWNWKGTSFECDQMTPNQSLQRTSYPLAG